MIFQLLHTVTHCRWLRPIRSPARLKLFSCATVRKPLIVLKNNSSVFFMNGCNNQFYFSNWKKHNRTIDHLESYETFSYPRSFHLNPDHGGVVASFFPARGDFVPFFENLTTQLLPCCSLCTARSCRVRRLFWRWALATAFVGNVQHLRIVSILGVLFAWWKPVNVDPMLYPVFSTCAFSPLPCSLQSPLLNGGR